MSKMRALLFAASLAACGGQTLDLGGDVPPDATDTLPDAGSVFDARFVAEARPIPNAGDGASWPVQAQRNARSLQSVGSVLYWMVTDGSSSEVRRCEKSDCGNTQVAVARISGYVTGFEIRGETLFGANSFSIFSCPLSDCRNIKTIVSGIQPRAVAFDDTNVYWAERTRDTNLYTCTLDCPSGSRSIALVDAAPAEIAVDASRIYWTKRGSSSIGTDAVMSAPKDNLGAATAIASGQNQATALSLHGGYVYWTTSYALGSVARCPTTGCAGTAPEMIADGQYYPHLVQSDGQFVFWMNGPEGPDQNESRQRPIQLLGCRLPSCATGIQLLGEGLGGGFAIRANADFWSTNGALPAKELVVDESAIYWLGEVFYAPQIAYASETVNAAVCRTEKAVR